MTTLPDSTLLHIPATRELLTWGWLKHTSDFDQQELAEIADCLLAGGLYPGEFRTFGAAQFRIRVVDNAVEAWALSEGYEVAHTGGNCRAWQRALANGRIASISDEDSGLGDGVAELYHVATFPPDYEDDRDWVQGEVLGFAQALAWVRHEESRS